MYQLKHAGRIFSVKVRKYCTKNLRHKDTTTLTCFIFDGISTAFWASPLTCITHFTKILSISFIYKCTYKFINLHLKLWKTLSLKRFQSYNSQAYHIQRTSFANHRGSDWSQSNENCDYYSMSFNQSFQNSMKMKDKFMY